MTKHVIEDRVKEATNTVGTSSLVLTGAAQGCRSFSSVMAIGDTCGYAVDNGTDWEVGIGTLTATDNLARTTVLTSSNSNRIVAFPAGSKQVFITVPAARMVDGTTLATVAKSGSYVDLTNKPELFSGSYADLTNKPMLFDGTYAALTGKPVLANVATSGSYADLLNKPTIPTQYTDANARAAISVSGSLGYNSATGVISYTAPALATVATSGSYADLTNKPTIPTAYTLPTASATVLGGIKLGTGLAIDGTGVVSVTTTGAGTVTSVNLTAGSTKVTVSGGPVTTSGSITVDVAEANLNHANIGGTIPIAKGGTGLTALGTAKQVHRTNAAATGTEWASLIAADVSGLATVATSGSYNDLTNKPAAYTLPAASATVRGGIRVGSGLTMTNGILGVNDPLSASFLQTYPSSVARTVMSKLRDLVSVKDFGAIGDGVTDDTTALQSAIDALNSSGGGMLFIPTGRYSISVLTLKSNVVLRGAGWSSVLVANTNGRMLQAGPTTSETITCAGLFDLMVDGNVRNNPAWATGSPVGTVQGIGLECADYNSSDFAIDNVFFYDTRLEGGYFYRIRLNIGTVKTKWCGLGSEADGSGIAMDSCGPSHIGYLDAQDVRGQWGIVIQSSTAPITLNDCYISGTQADGICIRGAQNISLMAGTIYGVTARGINLRGEIGEFGICKNIYVGPLHIEYSIDGYDGISVYQVNYVTIDKTRIGNFPRGIGFEGGSAYGGHYVLAPRFVSPVPTHMYNDNANVQTWPTTI